MHALVGSQPTPILSVQVVHTPPLSINMLPFPRIRTLLKTLSHRVRWSFFVSSDNFPTLPGLPAQSTPTPLTSSMITYQHRHHPQSEGQPLPQGGNRKVGNLPVNLAAQYRKGRTPSNSAVAELGGYIKRIRSSGCFHGPMPTLLPPKLPQLVMIDLIPQGRNRHKPPGKVQSDLIRAPTKRQERQISMPGPQGTADTEIGRPGRRQCETTFSRTSQPKAHIR